jgi:hypothetical protein
MTATKSKFFCSICGKPFNDEHVKGLPGNPVVSHDKCLFDAMAETRAKVKAAGGSNGLIKKEKESL